MAAAQRIISRFSYRVCSSGADGLIRSRPPLATPARTKALQFRARPASRPSPGFSCQRLNVRWTGAKNKTAGLLSESRQLDRFITPDKIATLMDAGRCLHARDFVLYLQLATLQLGDFAIVGRRMREGIGDFFLKRPMAGLELHKMLLNGHGEFGLLDGVES